MHCCAVISHDLGWYVVDIAAAVVVIHGRQYSRLATQVAGMKCCVHGLNCCVHDPVCSSMNPGKLDGVRRAERAHSSDLPCMLVGAQATDPQGDAVCS